MKSRILEKKAMDFQQDALRGINFIAGDIT